MSKSYDAVIVGAGPNGLSAAIAIAQAGHSTLVLEAEATIGGGTRSAELTLPGFTHDICSAIHPFGTASPFLAKLPLSKYGLQWVYSPAPLAHPFDDGTAIVLERSFKDTAPYLGRDAGAYWGLIAPLVWRAPRLFQAILAPIRPWNKPFTMAQFGLRALWPATILAKTLFREPHTRAFFAGMAAHAITPLEDPLTSTFALVLATLGHAFGWPFPRGGSKHISSALAAHLHSLGGEIRPNHRIESMDQLPSGGKVLFDLTPRQVLSIAGDQLPNYYRQGLSRYRYGPGIFKVDWALDGPIPWTAKDCNRAATIHLGGSLEEIAESERAPWNNQHAQRPYVIVAQHTLFDPSRAPEGKHTAWAYCHVPHGSTTDMTEQIESQIERFAPGFRQRILARHTMNSLDMQQHNANYIGGDINGGVMGLLQTFARPVARFDPYSTPNPDIFICSASTPPGGGVHGMPGFWAAQSALRRMAG